jgi:hypothetical protein
MRRLWAGFVVAGVCLVMAQTAAAAWTFEPIAVPTGQGLLDGVSCLSADDCVAVGASVQGGAGAAVIPDTIGISLDAGLAERWTGSSWAVLPIPVLSGLYESSLSAVSCSTTSACVAVGSSRTNTGVVTAFALRWDGTTWAETVLPQPTDAQQVAVPTAISCTGPAARACTAVGAYENTAGNFVPLTEVFRHGAWSLHSAVVPPSTNADGFNGVSCTAAWSCVAAGIASNQGATLTLNTLAERWNGRRWSLLATPASTGDVASFDDVSCASTARCTAVGTANYNSLAERWNGARWSVQTTPNPTDSTGTQLAGVSCPKSASCTSVGGAQLTAENIELAEQSSGRHWAIEPTPPALIFPFPFNEHISVSCWAAGACIAVPAAEGTDGSIAGSLLRTPATTG